MIEQQWHVVIQGKGQGPFPLLTVQSMIKEEKFLLLHFSQPLRNNLKLYLKLLCQQTELNQLPQAPL